MEALGNKSDGPLQLMKPSEYARLNQEAQQAYTKGLADVVVALEALGGPTLIESPSGKAPSRTREPASASGIRVLVNGNVVSCSESDSVCIFAGHMTCKKNRVCRMPEAASCTEGVRCHPVFGVGGDGKGFCVSRAETRGYQNVSKFCRERRAGVGALAAALGAEQYEQFAKDAWRAWEFSCWTWADPAKKKGSARIDRDKSACEAVSIAAYQAEADARKARAFERDGKARDAETGHSEDPSPD